MSNVILLAPHGDDETLFAAFTCMRERAHVIVCTQDDDWETRQQRSLETTKAITTLGCTYHEWPISAKELTWDRAHEKLECWNSTRLVASTPDRIYAPAVDPEGHEQHNLIGNLALAIFGEERVIPYGTYAPRGQRQKLAREVIPTAMEIQLKLQALAYYRTQIENPSTRPWFFELLDLREWLA